MTPILVVAALLTTLAAAYCAFADGALLALDEDEPPSAPVAAAFVASRERTHRALAFARIVAQLLAGATAVAALEASRIPAVQIGPLVVVAGVLVVVLAESGARAAGDIAGAAGVVRCARGMHAIERVMSPVVALGAWADRLLVAVLPPPPDPGAQREETVEQFREVVAAEAGVSPDDERLLRGVFSLADTHAQEIMVPRVDVIGIDARAAWADALSAVRAARHARYPVYERTLDNIVGILHAKDLLPGVLADASPDTPWRALVRPARFIPATKPVDALMRDLKASRQHMAVVVDEFGGTAGVVTLEDVLEVIVGEIRDEHDVEEAEVRALGDGRYSLSARVPLGDVNELMGSAFEREGVHTIGGLVFAAVGAVPRAGDSIVVEGFRLVVERVARRRIVRVTIGPAAVA
ncbi:MAG TPA: hemolysin family protein [Gemmatimonadaceae bacterium]|nr:hemolysin family protein [Gemmatimonadaceae bacterium]